MSADFTKDELKMILSNLEHVVFSRYYRYGMDKLRIKVKSMIDNYCEHKWSAVGNHPWLHCIKCKANFDYE